jgi:hypothetical protein
MRPSCALGRAFGRAPADDIDAVQLRLGCYQGAHQAFVETQR